MDDEIDPHRLLRAAKLALSLLELAREALWNLYPEELLALTQEDEKRLAAALAAALCRSGNEPHKPSS